MGKHARLFKALAPFSVENKCLLDFPHPHTRLHLFLFVQSEVKGVKILLSIQFVNSVGLFVTYFQFFWIVGVLLQNLLS